MKYDWILFDLDNTLMDFTQSSKKAFSSAFLEFGLREEVGHYDIYQEFNHSVWRDFEDGKIDAMTLRRKRFDDFMMEVGIKGITGIEFNKIYLNWLVEHSFLLDGSLDLLNELKAKVKLAIITNGLKEVQRRRIKRLEIEHFFPVIIVSDEEGVSKPSKAYFDIAFEACKNPRKDKVLVVGDSLNSDIKGGNNYGMDTCWCNLFNQINTTDINPNYEINQLSELHLIIS